MAVDAYLMVSVAVRELTWLLESPEYVARARIMELSQATGIQIEWLNVRKNTLEDVFIGSVSRREGEE